MQRVAIVGASVSLPFVLGDCDPITLSEVDPATGETITTLTTVDLHGEGDSSCCQYFADAAAGHPPSALPDVCKAAHITVTSQHGNADCSSNFCLFWNEGDAFQAAAGIPDDCCSEMQTSVHTGGPLSARCNPHSYCEIMDLHPENAIALAALLNKGNFAMPLMLAEVATHAAIVGASVSLPFVVGDCDLITQSEVDPATGDTITTLTTVDLHGEGDSSCCQYFADAAAGHPPSALPDVCKSASHITVTSQHGNADCSSNSCLLWNGGDASQAVAGIPDDCCSEMQTAYFPGGPLSARCNPHSYCAIMDLHPENAITLAALLNKGNFAMPLMFTEVTTNQQHMIV